MKLKLKKSLTKNEIETIRILSVLTNQLNESIRGIVFKYSICEIPKEVLEYFKIEENEKHKLCIDLWEDNIKTIDEVDIKETFTDHNGKTYIYNKENDLFYKFDWQDYLDERRGD